MSAERFLTENGKVFSDLIFYRPPISEGSVSWYVPEAMLRIQDVNLIPQEPIHPPVFEETYTELTIATYNGTVEPPRNGSRQFRNASGTWTFVYKLDGDVHSPWDGYDSLHGHEVHRFFGGGMEEPNAESRALYPGWYGHNWTMANDLRRLYRFIQGKDDIQCKINLDGKNTTQLYSGWFSVKNVNASDNGDLTVSISYDIEPPKNWGS